MLISDLLNRPELEAAQAKQDRVHSVSSSIVQCRYEGMRAVALGAELTAETRIKALLDLLALHLAQGTTYAGLPVKRDEVVVLIAAAAKGREESIDGLRTLIGRMRGGPTVHLLESQPDGSWVEPADAPIDLGDDQHYKSFAGLLEAVPAEPPSSVKELVAAVRHEAVRVYPMLTAQGWWSVRVEGLEVGRMRSAGGWLDVGKDGKNGDAQSAARKAWQEATSQRSRFPVPADDTASASAVLRGFVDAWLGGHGPVPGKQNEHALESRILRDAVPLAVDGTDLALIRGLHPIVNWGSQFPTKWGRDGSARYLDALLRDGDVPWAIEMKVSGSGGVGRYYRHAVAQAVLYRAFIQAAKPLHFWFEQQKLDADACKAAVVVPEMTGAQSRWLPELQTLCAMFDVALLHVPAAAANLR